MATQKDLLDALAEVSSNVVDLQTVEQSMETLIDGIAAQLKDALALANPTEAIAAAKAITANLTTLKAKMAADVAANTPAVPVTPATAAARAAAAKLPAPPAVPKR